MSASNVELIRRGYAAWNRGDVEGVLDLLDPNVDWSGYTHIPEAGHLHGHEEVRSWLERFLEAWEETDVRVVDLLESEDRIVALVRLSGRGRGSGVEVQGGVDAHAWTIRDGKVVAVTMYQGTADALRELGLKR